MSRSLVRLSKLMSLILRHEPEKFDVVLDAEGYTSVEELLDAIRSKYPDTTELDVRAVVESVEPDKRRFSILEGQIRANYGHSLDGRIAHEAAVPPDVLFHGTAERALAAISLSGLKPMARQYVHLTEDPALAIRVSARHGKPHLLKVEARRAHSDGIIFYRANRSFWLAVDIPAQYVVK